MRRALAIAALALSGMALLAAVWIVVPAPLYVLWLVAVLASEWSLYVGLAAVAGAGLGLLAARRGHARTGRLAAALGTLALALSLYPPLATLPVAAEQGAALSLARYTDAVPEAAAPAAETVAFAQVDGQTLRMDVYRPSNEEASARPAVVVVHGGAWKAGRRSDFPAWNAWLTRQGYVVFDVDYRLAPQPNWRTATDDVRAAVRYVKAHADAFGVDPARVALLGRSAGGHLALLAAYTADEAGRVAAVVGLYAPTDLAWGYAHPANPRVIDGPATLRDFTGGTPDGLPEVYAQASPIHHAGPASPPTLLIHGQQDQLVLPEQSTRLFDALERARGAGHELLLIPYAQHGFDYHFDGWGSQVYRATLRDFLRRHLGAP